MSGGSLEWRPYGISAIAPTFNLIQADTLRGHFCDFYTQPRYMAGLGIQLFSLLAKRIRLPDNVWYRAETMVLTLQGSYAGFLTLRDLPRPRLRFTCIPSSQS